MWRARLRDSGVVSVRWLECPPPGTGAPVLVWLLHPATQPWPPPSPILELDTEVHEVFAITEKALSRVLFWLKALLALSHFTLQRF